MLVQRSLLSALLVALCVTSAAWAAEPFLGANDVAAYLKQPEHARERAKQCAPIKADGAIYANCWAAQTAVKLLNESALTQELVFDRAKMHRIHLQCRGMAVKEVLASPECKALNDAGNFNLLMGSPKGSFIRF